MTVKVFGRRPLQVVREAWGGRTETAQARTRGAAATVYGDFDFCSVKVVAKPVGCWKPARAWWVRFAAGRGQNRDLAAADIRHVCADLGEGRARGHSPQGGCRGVRCAQAVPGH